MILICMNELNEMNVLEIEELEGGTPYKKAVKIK